MSESNRPNPNKWLSLVTMPIQMGATIYIFHLLGTWIDQKYGNVEGSMNKICTLMGVGLALYQIIKQVNRINKK